MKKVMILVSMFTTLVFMGCENTQQGASVKKFTGISIVGSDINMSGSASKSMMKGASAIAKAPVVVSPDTYPHIIVQVGFHSPVVDYMYSGASKPLDPETTTISLQEFNNPLDVSDPYPTIYHIIDYMFSGTAGACMGDDGLQWNSTYLGYMSDYYTVTTICYNDADNFVSDTKKYTMVVSDYAAKFAAAGFKPCTKTITYDSLSSNIIAHPTLWPADVLEKWYEGMPTGEIGFIQFSTEQCNAVELMIEISTTTE